MVTQMMEKVRENKVTAPCFHHRLIETPDGQVSKGVCKYCKAEKYFDNILQDRFSAESTPRAMNDPEYLGEDDGPGEDEAGLDDE